MARMSDKEFERRLAIIQPLHEDEHTYQEIADRTEFTHGQVRTVLNREQRNETQRESHAKSLTEFDKRYNILRKCKICGEIEKQLNFHHINPATRSFDITYVPKCPDKFLTDDVVRKELAKCILVCRSCHINLHNGNIKNSRWFVGKTMREIRREK